MSITNEDLLQLDCDILIPAAMSHQIHNENVSNIKAKLVIEAGNAPVTPDANEILSKRGVFVLPDILMNAGGVTVSYFECVQNIENEKWSLAEVNQKLSEKMIQATDIVIDKWLSLNESIVKNNDTKQDEDESNSQTPVDLHTTALIVALNRLIITIGERGIWP